jgi:hypothetical protein
MVFQMHMSVSVGRDENARLTNATIHIHALETSNQQGLGCGLDDNAESAAREIRFKPAQRDHQPVDSTAIAHIVFALGG